MPLNKSNKAVSIGRRIAFSRGLFFYSEGLLYLQFLQYLTHALHVLDAHGYKWQAQHVVDEAHLAEHGLHTCRVAVDKEQREEVGEAVVNLAGTIIFALHLQANHL